MTPRPTPEDPAKSGKVALIILSAVDKLDIGIIKLAQFLKGSKSKLVKPLSDKSIYGGLFWYDTPTITGFIEQLMEEELIRREEVAGVEYANSILKLTPAGKKVLVEKIPIELQARNKIKPITVGESEMATLALLKQGKTPEQVAEERGLATATIYLHAYKLIINKMLFSFDIIKPEIIRQIREVSSRFSSSPPLKKLKEALPSEITYEQIRCVLADKQIN